MTQENGKAKGPDYSTSAVELCNPPKVKELLDKLHAQQAVKDDVMEKLKAQSAELMAKMQEIDKAIVDTIANVKSTVDALGSYQDIEAGDYAIKQERKTKQYHVDKFKAYSQFEPYAPAVIQESINVKALEGLVKGTLIAAEDLRNTGVITESVSFSYIVR